MPARLLVLPVRRRALPRKSKDPPGGGQAASLFTGYWRRIGAGKYHAENEPLDWAQGLPGHLQIPERLLKTLR